MALFYPGLPNIRSLTPREIVSYLQFKHDVATGHSDDDEDFDEG